MPAKAVPAPTIENSADFGLISPRQLAAELRMSVRTLERLHATRTGPPRVTLNRHIFYRRSTVDAWLTRTEGFEAARPAPRLRKHVAAVGRARRARAVA
jgi:predicted DNA-binding transcriptional regulator AlpA